jgi:agmatinase
MPLDLGEVEPHRPELLPLRHAQRNRRLLERRDPAPAELVEPGTQDDQIGCPGEAGGVHTHPSAATPRDLNDRSFTPAGDDPDRRTAVPAAVGFGRAAHVTIDPLDRWRPLPDKPDYAGFLSFGGAPIAQEPAHLDGVDVAIVGAPMDDLVSDRPGARYAPRAIRAASCPPGPQLEVGVDAFAELRVVDYGDAPVLPADPTHSHTAISKLIGEVVDAGVIPVTLGGDHSITEPCASAVAARRGPIGLIHFDTHTDTGREVFGIQRSHGTPMFRLVEAGAVDGERYAQIGLRGYWPGPAEFEWQRDHGIASFFMHDVRDLGIREVVERALAHVGEGPLYLTVDVDVLDPAFAPGTGTPEPGGMTPVDLLWAVREIAARVELAAADVVEVIPTAVGSADITALVAERVVREVLTGLALRSSRARTASA